VLFGTTPDDEEVGRLVRDAVKKFADIGASVVDVQIPGLDDLLQGTSVINAEFKFDLLDFLKRYPNAPVHSLGEIIASGKCDPAIDGVLKRAEAVPVRESDTYAASLAKRDAVRQQVWEAMGRAGATMLAYPTLRRKAAPIGQPQAGSNCQLSATTGFPSIAIPAGFTSDGIPVGFELLGAPYSEPLLLKAAYVWEQVLNTRRPPKDTVAGSSSGRGFT
jgi:Asp-tRNA(Asn)/Glu-tRNA(Gln) amidotransferase A subunit family amidase